MPELGMLKTKGTFRVNLWITFVGFVDTHLLIPVMSLYAAQLGARVGVVGLIIGLYSISNAPANIFFGRLVDRVGPKIPLTFGLLGDALSMFLYSFCKVPFHLTLVRFFHGISGGIVGPATMSITAEHTTDQRRGHSMAFYGISLAAATLVGYLVSGTLALRLGYEFVFYIGALLLISGAIITQKLPVRERSSSTPTESFKLNLCQIVGLMKRKELRVSYSSVFAQYFAFGGVVTLLPLYLKSLGMNAFQLGMLLATFAITFIAFQLPSGILSDRLGRRIPIVTGLSLCIASLALLPTVKAFLSLISIMALYGASYALIFPSISAMVADYSSPEEWGRATGIFHALLTIGVAIGAPVIGWTAEVLGTELGLAMCGAAAVAALLIVAISSRHN